MESVGGVIVAAGSGRRFAISGPAKQFQLLLGTPLIAWSVSAFRAHPAIGPIVLVLPPALYRTPPAWIEALGATLAAGGAERADSVAAGLDALGAACDRVLVHDAARPLVPQSLIDGVLDATPGEIVIPGLPLVDTLKEVEPDGTVRATLDRARFRTIQTPQSFPIRILRDVHARARTEGWTGTDDAALAEQSGHRVRVVPGDPRALKVTTPGDLALLECLAHSLPRPRPPEGDEAGVPANRNDTG